MKFQCKKCNYLAERKDMPAVCPYCGSPKSMERAKGAQDFLDDVRDEEVK